MTTPIERNGLELDAPAEAADGARKEGEEDDATTSASVDEGLASTVGEGSVDAASADSLESPRLDVDTTKPEDVEQTTETEAGADPSASEPSKPKPLQALVDLLHDLAIAVVVCVLLITYVVQAFKVQGTSMAPELGDGERILVNKFLYHFGDIRRGDIVVFWYPEDPGLSFIKRVVGLPGETVEIREGAVYVDGERVAEDYVKADNADRRNYPKTSIRAGHYFVLGDNRRGSNDSRSWGFVPERYIYGKAFLRIWPLGELGTVD